MSSFGGRSSFGFDSVKNTGTRAGAEVVQLYIAESKPKLERPPKELKGFQRVALKAGESAAVKFEIDQRALSYYDALRHNWLTDFGDFEVQVGASSRDIRARAKLTYAAPLPPKREPPIGALPPKGAKPAARSGEDKGKAPDQGKAPSPFPPAKK